MVGIYKLYGGKNLVGIANSWEDFVLYRSKKLLEKDSEYYGGWEYRHYENMLKKDFWAEPLENFSDYLEG